MLGIDQQPVQGKRRGCLTVFGWLVFVALLVLAGIFGYKVWVYYGKITRGEVINLPQFTASFTRMNKAPLTAVPAVARAVIEGSGSPSSGSNDAKLTIVEFADFECPFSRQESAVFRSAMLAYSDKVKFIYRHYPITEVHQNAFQAASAAECAAEQGKFWPFHDKLFGGVGMGSQDLLNYSDQIGLDRKQFERCLSDNRYKEKVEADIKAGREAGVVGTPTFFFNGEKIEGAIPDAVLGQLIDRFIK